MNDRCSILVRKANTSPFSPQPKQWKNWRTSWTLKEGVFSAWKGHSPFQFPVPARLSSTWRLITSTRFVRSRTSSIFSLGIKGKLNPRRSTRDL